MRIIAFDFVIKHKEKKFDSVDAFFKRFDYQSVNIEITRLLFTFQKKLNMINSLNVSVISKVCTLCVVVSRNLYFNNVSFEIEFLKNLKNENFRTISLFIKKIENREIVLDVFRVIAITLTNNNKNFEKILQNLYMITS